MTYEEREAQLVERSRDAREHTRLTQACQSGEYDNISDDDGWKSFNKKYGNSETDVDFNYGVTRGGECHNFEKGAKMFDRAILYLSYIVKDVEELENGQVVKVTYDDGEVEYYTGYDLVSERNYVDADMAHAIAYATDDVKTAKNIAFDNCGWNTMDEDDLKEMIQNAFDLNDEDDKERYDKLMAKDFEEMADEWESEDEMVENYVVFKVNGKGYVADQYIKGDIYNG